MPCYSVVEGEGVAGPIAGLSAETTAMHSCIGVVMVNGHTNFAGLYHYGANSLDEPLTSLTLLQMLNDLAPTHIFITAPPLGTGYIPGSTQFDRDDLDDFLHQHAANANIGWMPDRRFSNFGIFNGVFGINISGNVGGGSRRTIEMATQMPNSVGRRINANTMFYGGKGPNRPQRDHAVDDSVLAT